MAKRSKSVERDTFGEAGGEQIISPLSFQLNGHGTPQHPCDMIPEEDGTKESYVPPDPLKLGTRNVDGS